MLFQGDRCNIYLPIYPQGGEWAPGVEAIHRRARLYLAQLPPDQLNPRGHYDAALQPVYDRATRRRRHSGPSGDPRLSSLPLDLPPPGARLLRKSSETLPRNH